MREYTTQMDAARKGIITPELTKLLKKIICGKMNYSHL